MGFTYFKRFRMEIDLRRIPPSPAILPDGFEWIFWSESLLDRHARAKYYSFREEIDAKVFRCLGDFDGCRRLMTEISNRESFLPAATWLIHNRATEAAVPHDCATIQGLAQHGRLGAVQNVGVVPEYRRLGLGRALVLKAIEGFRQAGMERVYLEVTARNTSAVTLYRSLGFEFARTVYKAVEEPIQVS